MAHILGRRLDEHEAYTNLVEALRVAESSAHQLAFMREQKAWRILEDSLGNIRLVASKLVNLGPSRAITIPPALTRGLDS